MKGSWNASYTRMRQHGVDEDRGAEALGAREHVIQEGVHKETTDGGILVLVVEAQ